MKKLFLCAILSACFIWLTGGLQCLQCVDPRAGGKCRDDYKALVNASLGLNHQYYVKTCVNDTENNFTQPYCVIEEFYEGDVLKSFIRDCSDGQTFSFTEFAGDGSVSNRYPKLTQVRPDNYTTCIYSSQSRAHICVTLCEGDFCNAPRPNLTDDSDDCSNSTDNETCAAGSLHVISGPFGPLVDGVLGRGYFMPLLVTLISVLILG